MAVGTCQRPLSASAAATQQAGLAPVGIERNWRRCVIELDVAGRLALSTRPALVAGGLNLFEIFGEIEKWLADKSKHEAVDILRKFEVPCAPVLSMKEIAHDPALRASGTVVEVDHKERGTYLTVGSPIKFSDFTPQITSSPLLGEHTDDVLTELGYTADAIAEMHAARVV
jgi:formyl-CoA transferase